MGDSVIIHVEGEEADAALVQLVELVDGKFGEE
jgi:phosphotransferase system HPr-like phosphotransfer protein